MTRGVVTAEAGVRLRYRRLGTGPGMALLHGFPQTGHRWRQKGFTVSECGHFIPEERPAVVVDAVLRFAGVPPRPS
jgi:pimeloyl-ACP methyl ester carboxylesterase